MAFIISILINAGIVFVVAYLLPTIKIKSYGSAVLVAFFVGLLNATIGWILRGMLNLATLGLLSFIVHLVVTAVVIKLVDKLVKGFEVKGFIPAIILAVVIALVGTLLNTM